MNIQRQFGRLTVKGAGNDAKVQVILDDFEEADKCLAQLVEAVRHWRDAWTSILTVQFGIVNEFEQLYNPIIGASDGHSQQNFETSDNQLSRTVRLKEAYGELKTDLLEEVNMMDARIIKPATDAREYIKPLKKVIKKRDDKRLDYERYQDRVNNASKKKNKSERDELAYSRAQEDLAKAAELFQSADDHIREALPPLIAACFSLLPHLLSAQIMTQNTLLAQYYTVLYTYCGEEGFETPPPSIELVVQTWESDFKPIQNEAESLTILAKGKAVHAPMQLPEEPGKKTLSGLNLRNNFAQRRTSSQNVPTVSSGASSPGRLTRIPSSNTTSSQALARNSRNAREEDEENSYHSSHLSPPLAANFASRPPSGPGEDYFQMKPQPQRLSSASSTGSLRPTTPGSLRAGSPGTPRLITAGSQVPSSFASSIAAKKKPPPPPPKRIGSYVKETWVVALYGFTGQEDGDLSFAEGERIKVMKKTGSTDDWWEGEVRGVTGKFPANYCELTN